MVLVMIFLNPKNATSPLLFLQRQLTPLLSKNIFENNVYWLMILTLEACKQALSNDRYIRLRYWKAYNVLREIHIHRHKRLEEKILVLFLIETFSMTKYCKKPTQPAYDVRTTLYGRRFKVLMFQGINVHKTSFVYLLRMEWF